METVFRSFDKGFVGLHLLVYGESEEGYDDAEQGDSANQETCGTDRFCRQVAEVDHDRDNTCRKSAEPGDRYRVLELDLLEEAEGDNACNSAEERRKQERKEYVARVCGPKLSTVSHNAYGNQRKAARVQHQEHNLGIARDGFVFVRVDFLQLLHGLQTHGGGGVVEPEHVGADVHEHSTNHRVVLRNFGEEPAEQRRDNLCENLDRTSFFANLHDAKPERKDAGKTEGNFKCGLGHVEGTENSLVEDSGVAEGNPLDHAGDKSAKEEYEPNNIQNHVRKIKKRRTFEISKVRLECLRACLDDYSQSAFMNASRVLQSTSPL